MVYFIYLCLEFRAHTLFKITKPNDINRSTKTAEVTKSEIKLSLNNKYIN